MASMIGWDKSIVPNRQLRLAFTLNNILNLIATDADMFNL